MPTSNTLWEPAICRIAPRLSTGSPSSLSGPMMVMTGMSALRKPSTKRICRRGTPTAFAVRTKSLSKASIIADRTILRIGAARTKAKVITGSARYRKASRAISGRPERKPSMV